jgi:hypothetical protein
MFFFPIFTPLYFYKTRPFEEDKLLKMGYAFEKATRMRKIPENMIQ